MTSDENTNVTGSPVPPDSAPRGDGGNTGSAPSGRQPEAPVYRIRPAYLRPDAAPGHAYRRPGGNGTVRSYQQPAPKEQPAPPAPAVKERPAPPPEERPAPPRGDSTTEFKGLEFSGAPAAPLKPSAPPANAGTRAPSATAAARTAEARTAPRRDPYAERELPKPVRPTANGRDTKKQRRGLAGFFASFLPWSGDSAGEGLRKIVMDFSALVVVACFVYFVNNYIDHREQQMVRAEIQSMQSVEADNASILEQQWLGIKAKFPDVEFPEGMNIRYANLYAKNQEFCGWITIPGTQVDYAVMHHPADEGSEEEDYYLHHDMEGSYSRYGEIYLDGSNTGSSLDRNNVIYGHNMTDGMLFAALEKYYTVDGYAQIPVIQYNTLYADYYFKVYAAFITNGYSTGDNDYLFNYVTTDFPSDENFEKFIAAIDERKLYDTGVDINVNDKLLTLSTCSYEISGGVMGRLAVIGRLVREGESASVDTSRAKVNPNPRYPQVWYDEHNMSNPYYNADRWTVYS